MCKFSINQLSTKRLCHTICVLSLWYTYYTQYIILYCLTLMSLTKYQISLIYLPQWRSTEIKIHPQYPLLVLKGNWTGRPFRWDHINHIPISKAKSTQYISNYCSPSAETGKSPYIERNIPQWGDKNIQSINLYISIGKYSYYCTQGCVSIVRQLDSPTLLHKNAKKNEN